MLKKYTKIQLLNIVAFLIVPMISSVISTIHLIDLFKIGNYSTMAISLSIVFELGSLASALSITVLNKISKFATWSIFIILVIFQMIGNVYYTFNFILVEESMKSDYLEHSIRFIKYFIEIENVDEIRMMLAIIIGIPIPLISLAFLKTLVDYISNVNAEEIKEILIEAEEVQQEEIKEEIDEDVVLEKNDETVEIDYEILEEKNEEVLEEILSNENDIDDLKHVINGMSKQIEMFNREFNTKIDLNRFYKK